MNGLFHTKHLWNVWMGDRTSTLTVMSALFPSPPPWSSPSLPFFIPPVSMQAFSFSNQPCLYHLSVLNIHLITGSGDSQPASQAAQDVSRLKSALTTNLTMATQPFLFHLLETNRWSNYCIGQSWANYDLGGGGHMLSFLIWPAELAEIILILSK